MRSSAADRPDPEATMASIADILIAKGNAAAAGALARGNIYADLIRNLSSVPGQVIQSQRQYEQDQLRQQALQQQLAESNQNLQLGRMQMQEKQRDLDAQSIIGSLPRGPNGELDIPALENAARQHDPLLVPHVTALAQKLNTATSDYQTAQLKADELRADRLGDVGLQLLQNPTDLGSFQLAVAELANKGLIPKTKAPTLLKNAVEQPGFITQQAQEWIRGSKEARAATAPKVVMQKPDEVPLIQQTTPGGGVSLTPAPGVPVVK